MAADLNAVGALNVSSAILILVGFHNMEACCIPPHIHTRAHARCTDKSYIFNSGSAALRTVTYLGFDEPLGRLNLGFTESPSVFGAHVRPYSQVGGLLQRLKAISKKKELILKHFHLFIYLFYKYCLLA